MRFIFRMGLIFLAMLGSYVGSLKFQSTNPADFLSGGAIITVCAVVLFLFSRKLWKFLGCFSTLGLVLVLIGGMIFFVSGGDMFNNLVNAVTGKSDSAATPQPAPNPYLPQPQPLPPQAVPQQQPQPAETQQQPTAPQSTEAVQPVPQQPQVPVLQGRVSKILGGDKIIVNGMPVRLYGIAAPVLGQSCTDAHNRGYDCGYIAARKLQEIIGSDPVSCKIMNKNNQGDLMAACSVASFDIGAVMVEAGCAIALPQITPIYVPYEQKARTAKEGLWEGQFQAPWEWQAQQKQIQERASKIKVPKVTLPSKKKKSIFDNF